MFNTSATLIIIVAAIGLAGVGAYQLLDRIKEAADERAKTSGGPRAGVWTLVALFAAGGLFVLHHAAVETPHVVEHITHSIYSEP
jgi:hypothetical protein